MTDSLAVVTKAIYDRFNANTSLNLADVWYGVQPAIPRTPAVSVEADTKRRTITDTGAMTRNDFTVFVTVYHSKLQDSTVTRQEMDELAESVEDVLHEDRKFDGLLIHSYVLEVASGFARLGSTIMKASRLTWTGFSKTRLV